MDNKLKNKTSRFHRIFIYILMLLAVIAIFYLFKPFLAELMIAAILASVCFTGHEKLTGFLKGRAALSATLICLAVLLLIIIPMLQLVFYAAKQAPIAYNQLEIVLTETDIMGGGLLSEINISEEFEEMVKGAISEVAGRISGWLASAASIFVKNTTNFIFSLLIILFATFYFLLHGRQIRKKILFFSPLPPKYNLEIIKSFRSISRTTLLSLFVSALAQGLLSALGFVIIGWPFWITFIISAFLSIIPYMLGLFFLPIIAYLLLSGQIWQGILIIVWNLIFVVNFDELIRAYIAKGDTKINMVFMLFAILGGIGLFGFWGIFIGPLVVALTMTILNIYALEFNAQLDKKSTK